MGSRSQRVQVTGDILLKARLEMENADKAIGQINKSFNSLEVGDKFLKDLEKIGERIGDALPDLKKKLDVDAINLGDLKGVTKDMDQLVRMLDTYESKLRSIKPKDLKVTSPELEQQRQAMAAQETLLKEFKKNTKLDLQIEGYGAGTSNIIKIKDELQKAVASGKDLQEVLRDATARSEGQVNAAKQRFAELDKEYTAIRLLEQELLLREQIRDAILATKGGAFDDTLKTQLAELGKMKPLLREDMKMAYGYKQKAGVVGDDAELQQIRDKIAGMAALQSARDKARRALEAEQAKHSDVEAFSRDNLPAIRQYEQQLTTLNNALAEAVTTAKELTETLTTQKVGEFGKTADEIRGVRDGIKGVAEGAREHGQAVDAETTSMNNSVASFRNKITQMFGLYNIYQLIRRGIQDAYRSIKELDTAMNEIAVVTTMTTDQLWGQINAYMAVAKQYGVATQGVYEVSKLYYQQGRDAVEVAQLTGETLKMAKIAGIDYAKATDNMTVALNGFKLSASDASTVVDVYSQLAARSAVDTEELAYAMSKTASIAESAGMSFENTSVFLAQMIETTREAPENIGTAMKTIIARFTEMKKDPLKILDVEGEEVSFNRVDTALRSIGMTLRDASGQFRDLDEVIYELADKWDTLDRNTQRYIATTVAGSRQQSRFLALMQDSDRLVEMREEAMNSEDAGLVQYAKTLDSLESKLAQLRTSLQQFYMGLINGPLIKGIIDMGTKVVTFFNNIPKAAALTMVPGLIMMVRGALRVIGTFLITSFKKSSTTMVAENRKAVLQMVKDRILGEKMAQAGEQSVRSKGRVARGIAAGAYGMSIGGAGTASTIVGAMGGWVSVAIGALSIVSAIVGLIQQSNEDMKTLEQRVREYKDNLEKKNIERATTKSELKDLVALKKRYDELNKTKHLSNENNQEWLNLNQQIYEKYPELLNYIDAEGNAIVSLGDRYEYLRSKKEGAYNQAFNAHVIEQIKRTESKDTLFDEYLPEAFKQPALDKGVAKRVTESRNEGILIDTLRSIAADMRSENEERRTLAIAELDRYNRGETEIRAAIGIDGRIVFEGENSFGPVGWESSGGPAITILNKNDLLQDSDIFEQVKKINLIGAYGSDLSTAAYRIFKEGGDLDALLKAFESTGIVKLLSETQGYKDSGIKTDTVLYDREKAQEFLRKIVDNEIDISDVEQENIQNLFDLVKIYAKNWDEILNTTPRIIQQAFETKIKDIVDFDLEEVPGRIRNALQHRAFLKRIESAYDQFDYREGETENDRFQRYLATQAKSEVDAVDKALMQRRSDFAFNEAFEEANQIFENVDSYSLNYINSVLNSVDDTIKEILMPREGEQSIQDKALNTVLTNHNYIRNLLGEDQGKSEKKIDFKLLETLSQLSGRTQQAVVEQIENLAKLEASDGSKDLRTVIPEGINPVTVAQKYMETITELVDDNLLTPEMAQRLEGFHPTSITSIFDFFDELIALYPEFENAGLWLRQFGESNLQMTEAEAIQATSKFFELEEKLREDLAKPLSLSQISEYMDRYGFELDDFTQDGFVKDQDAAIQTILSSRETLFDIGLSTLDVINEGYAALVRRMQQANQDSLTRKRFNTLTKLADPSKRELGTLNQPDLRSLSLDAQKRFVLTGDGTYKFMGSYEEFLSFLEGFTGGLIELTNLLNNIVKDSQTSKRDSLREIAREIVEGYDVKTEEFVIGDKIREQIIKEKILTEAAFNSLFEETEKGWVARTTEVYSTLRQKLSALGISDAVISSIFESSDEENRQILVDETQKAIEENRKQAGDLIKSFEFKDGLLTIGRTVYEKLGETVQEMLDPSGLDEWVLKDGAGLADFIKASIAPLDSTDPSVQAAIVAQHKVLENARNEYMRSMRDFIESMLTNVGDIIKQAEDGSFKDKRTAEVIKSALAKTSGIGDISLVEGLFGFELHQKGINETSKLTKKFYEDQKINWAAAKRYVKEEKYNLDEIYELEEELAKLEIETAKQLIELTQQQLSLVNQIAAALADAYFDPSSYDFMSNSPTNRKLEPMYTLMDNVMSAYKALEGGRDGEAISTKDVNAILDFIGRDTDDPMYTEIAKMAKNINPPLEMKLSNEQLDYLQGGMGETAQERADEYNRVAELVDNQNKEISESKDYVYDETRQFTRDGETYDTTGKLMDYLELTQDQKSLQKLMDRVAITMDKKPEKDQRTLQQVLHDTAKTMGMLPGDEAERAKTLADNIGNQTTAMTTLASAIQALASVIGTFKPKDEKPPAELPKPGGTTAERRAEEKTFFVDDTKKSLDNAADSTDNVTQAMAKIESAIALAGSAIDILSGKSDGTSTSMEGAGDSAQQAGDKIASGADTATGGLDKAGSAGSNAAGNISGLDASASAASGQISGLGGAAQNAASVLASIKAPNWGSPGGSKPGGGPGANVEAQSKAGGGPIARKGQALVGEFGPELGFYNGRYYMLGENGPEFRNLPRGMFIFDHLKTQKIMRTANQGLGSSEGLSFAKGTYNYGRPQVNIDVGAWLAQTNENRKKPGSGGKKEKEKELTPAEFDRWYNYLRIIADVEYAIAELQAARENLFGTDYTKSLAKEIKLLDQQATIVEKYRDAQLQYLANFEATKVAEYGEYLEIVNGVLQIHQDKLQGMDTEAAEPIQKVMEEWEGLIESISGSTQQLEEFRAQQRKLREEMRQTYIDVEKKVIDGIKYQQQMLIDNLQKQLDMKVKYDNKYLEALRKSIDKERQMRERADTESERARLQRRIALLKRDTSGKSALSLAEAERQLQGLNQSAYDQRQDDFLKSEEEALLQAQKVISDELEIQTAVLQLMNDNIQLIQETVDAIMTSGPENLALFLQNWTQEYLNSSPTNQEKMSEEFADLAGKVQGYIMYMSGTLEASIGELNLGLTELTNLMPSVITAINNAGNSGGGGGSGSGGGEKPSTPKVYEGKYYSRITKLTYTATSTISQQDANDKAKQKGKRAEAALKQTSVGTPDRGMGTPTVSKFADGGLVDYTGPAIVHGTKRKPEAVLNPVQTGILQNLVQVLDGDFGKKIVASMVRPNSLPVTESNENSNIVIEQVVFEPGVISSDYDMKRASNVFQETLLDIAKYQGNISLRRK